MKTDGGGVDHQQWRGIIGLSYELRIILSQTSSLIYNAEVNQATHAKLNPAVYSHTRANSNTPQTEAYPAWH